MVDAGMLAREFNADELPASTAWLLKNEEFRTERVRHEFTSYAWSHVVSRSFFGKLLSGGYVSNAAFLIACYRAGVIVEPTRSAGRWLPAAYVGISPCAHPYIAEH